MPGRVKAGHGRGGLSALVVQRGTVGVYGLAGLVLELLPEYPGVKVKVIPGVTAALAGGAVLGAPLCHDFAVTQPKRSADAHGKNPGAAAGRGSGGFCDLPL